jgi:16S rRNA (guanine966-N2)-methyltransferase
MTDRVREAIFDILGSRYGTPGALPPVTVADVFCGGGSLGLEALSRGATRACFFDRSVEALRVLKENLNRLEVGPEGVVVPADIWKTAVRSPPRFGPLDLIFLDPPFHDARDVSNRSRVASLLRRLGAGASTTAETLIVFRHEEHLRTPEIVGKYWSVEQRREYGRSALSLLRRGDAPADEADAEQISATDDDVA